MVFKKAERKQVKLKIAMTGPSGSGKTFSSLLIAKGIGGKVAVIDTENGSASLYSGLKTGPLAGFSFDVCEIASPYTIGKYIDAIKAAQDAGYDVLVIDSITHAWAGEGGLLSKKESLDARGGNSYTNWAGVTKEHEQFKAMLLGARVHLVCTIRSKQDYVLETNEKGKQAPRKVGLAPIQRDGMEYEFTTVFDCGMDHAAVTSKDRTGLFDGVVEKISENTGKSLIKWLAEAKPETATVGEQVVKGIVDTVVTLSTAAQTQGTVQPSVAAPKPETHSNGLAQESGVPCNSCGAELKLHHTKAGYICPNAKAKNDGHTRIALAELGKYQQRSKTLGLSVSCDDAERN